MITINEKSREMTEVEIYLMTVSPAIKTMKEVPDGTSITVDAVLNFTDVKEDETSSCITSIMTPDKTVYAFQSKTFYDSLKDIQTIMKEKSFSIIKTSGKTKNGRDYINCELDLSSL